MGEKQRMLALFRKGVPEEYIPQLPVAEIAGDSRVLIEHHRCITSYCDSLVCVEMSYGLLQIEGEELTLQQMSQAQLVITGKINSVSIERRVP